MKRPLLTVGVLTAVVCGALGFAATGISPMSFLSNLGSPKSDQTKQVLEEVQTGLSISDEQTNLSRRLAESEGAGTTSLPANAIEFEISLFGSDEDRFNTTDGDSFDFDTRTYVINGKVGKYHSLVPIMNENYYAWYSNTDTQYIFSGNYKANEACKIRSVIVSNNSIVAMEEFDLNESNNFSLDFSLSYDCKYQGRPLYMAFGLIEGTEGTSVTASNLKFYIKDYALVAEKWTPESNLPGLGLDNEYEEEMYYTVIAEDGISTIGLRYDGSEIYIMGINTTASELTIPKYIMINDTPIQPFCLGYNCFNNWEGALSLTKLDITNLKESNFDIDFNGSNITDIYINKNLKSENLWNVDNIYLHIPYSSERNNFTSYGFKRVLVGAETPEYPETNNSHWTIKGDREGDYFGISFDNDGYFRLSEIFTQNDSISLPLRPYENNQQYIVAYFGFEDNKESGTTFRNAPKLTKIAVPEHYKQFKIKWGSNYSNYNGTINDIYMYGDAPEAIQQTPSKINVHIANQEYFSNYQNNSKWNKANLLPFGWDYDWITVNVTRKGEFAQTYIEMTDADWSLAMNVKVTGTLNETDLKNIKNLSNLRKLDLSEATFDKLPNGFLQNHSLVQSVILPDSLESIPDNAFYRCSKLMSVTAPGLKSIGLSAFQYCSFLEDLDITNVEFINANGFADCTKYNPGNIPAGLRSVGYSAFENTAITEAVIPEIFTELPEYMFRKCSKLTNVTLPSSLQKIGHYCFDNCQNLEQINFPESLTTIEQSAFSYCTKLTSIHLPESLTTIENGAFQNCNSLTELTLPSTLKSIAYDALNNCSALKTIKCKAVVPPIANNNFTNGIDYNHCALYVAPFSIDAYRAANNWNAFYIVKPLDEPVKNIYINRPVSLDLLSEDNAVLQGNPNIVLDYGNNTNNIGQLSAKGDGTLSAGVFKFSHRFNTRNNKSYDYRTTLINNAENMRADSVICAIDLAKNTWHFFSLQYDVNMQDVFGLDGTDFVIREYDGASRAISDGTTSNWKNLESNEVLKAGKGYIIQAANNAPSDNPNKAIVYFPSRNSTTKNNIFTSNNIIVPLEEFAAEFAHNRSWNLIGNPYPCYYDMHYLMDDFSAPITLWRGSGYQAYSPVDDDIILRPNEAFFVQRPLDAEQITFGVEGRMHFTDAYNANSTPGISYAPALNKNNSSRSIFNFNIEGAENDDRARIVINEDASRDYEISRDANKFFAQVASGVEIFVNDDVTYSICERPFDNGSATLGIRVANDGQYSISLDGRNYEGWSVILTDTETGISTELTNCSYAFEAKAGSNNSRFIVSFKAPNLSAIDSIDAADSDINVKIVSTDGLLLFEGNFNDFTATAQPGVYVVICGEKATKIVVK